MFNYQFVFKRKDLKEHQNVILTGETKKSFIDLNDDVCKFLKLHPDLELVSYVFQPQKVEDNGKTSKK